MEEAEEGAVMGACPMWNLPDEILLSMLAFLPIEDLCNVIQVRFNSYMNPLLKFFFEYKQTFSQNHKQLCARDSHSMV